MDAALQRIVAYEHVAAMPVLGQWFTERQLQQAIEGECCTPWPLASIEPKQGDYQFTSGERLVLPLDGGDAAIVAFCETADNMDLPHLMVLHRSFGIECDTDMQRLRRAVSSIDPQGRIEQLCMYQHGDQPPAGLGFRLRSHYLAARVQDIAATSVDGDSAALQLVEPDSLDFFDVYMQWYREFWQRRPDLQPHVRVEPYEDVAAYYEGRGVRLLILDGQLCGMMAAKQCTEHGLIGWRICEKVIAPSHWGRGLSVAANVLFARALRSEEHFAMWGTIAPGNQASLQSAHRASRRIVGSTYWLAMK